MLATSARDIEVARERRLDDLPSVVRMALRATMRIYLGQTRDPRLIATLEASGYGECTCRGELPPRRQPSFYDNGAFRDWRAGRHFDLNRWLRDLCWMRYRAWLPDFHVVPDLVAGGAASLAFSLDMLDKDERVRALRALNDLDTMRAGYERRFHRCQ